MASSRIDAFDATVASTRCTLCAGFSMRSFFTFSSQLPSSIVSKIGQLPRGALGTTAHPQDAESDGEMPAAGGVGKVMGESNEAPPRSRKNKL